MSKRPLITERARILATRRLEPSEEDAVAGLDWLLLSVAVRQVASLLPAAASAEHLLSHQLANGSIRIEYEGIYAFDRKLEGEEWEESEWLIPTHRAKNLALVDEELFLAPKFWEASADLNLDREAWDWGKGVIVVTSADQTGFKAEGCLLNARDVEALKVRLLLGELDIKPFQTRPKRGRKREPQWAMWIGQIAAMVQDKSIFAARSANGLIELASKELTVHGRWNGTTGVSELDRTTLYSAASEVLTRLGISVDAEAESKRD